MDTPIRAPKAPDECAIVDGGGLRRPWAIPMDSVIEVEGKECNVASKCDRVLRKFLGVDGCNKTWGVLDAITSCRQQAVQDWCAKRLFEGDPNGDRGKYAFS